ncbi:damage-control phosphatase ARMT1 family protein [Oceanirhabdus seepicola]|uniref:DUF89 family protein n=1 Tax=Oceanirhabdus seepicola TaxID=2828781 RepID=A0A9J6NZ80_9CLOT|nr:ARMT1-like domain-containing protein [Oceanirhabdus seepicola]MCM1989380.1 DUF89 family protein [Oceanirhabdus seepicola]
MKVTYECLTCLVRQSTEAARMVTEDIELQQKIIKHTLQEVGKLDFSETAPYLGSIIHKYIKEISNNPDPYKELKAKYNDVAFQICEDLKLSELVKSSDFPLDTACRLAMAGNIIDFSVSILVEEEQVRETIEKCFKANIHGSTADELLDAANKANKILYLADNSGEIVFDKFLINELPKEKITYVVKGEPVVNDATMDDAVSVGMIDLVRVIDNGSDAQGTIFDLCSDEFKNEFEEADLIISKGQANYETLSDVQNKEMFFLLKAKCKSVANNIECIQGDLVMKRVHVK